MAGYNCTPNHKIEIHDSPYPGTPLSSYGGVVRFFCTLAWSLGLRMQNRGIHFLLKRKKSRKKCANIHLPMVVELFSPQTDRTIQRLFEYPFFRKGICHATQECDKENNTFTG